MKKLLLLFTLVPFLSFANYYKATVNLNDGSSKVGFVELPDNPSEQKLKFKSDEKGKVEKLPIDDVAGFDIVNTKNETVHFISI